MWWSIQSKNKLIKISSFLCMVCSPSSLCRQLSHKRISFILLLKLMGFIENFRFCLSFILYLKNIVKWSTSILRYFCSQYTILRDCFNHTFSFVEKKESIFYHIFSFLFWKCTAIIVNLQYLNIFFAKLIQKLSNFIAKLVRLSRIGKWRNRRKHLWSKRSLAFSRLWCPYLTPSWISWILSCIE